ncbi:hypothetical protein DL96DRAFT_1724506 [Flagelloscypha sp. PMI_526]|nr:hypothetical protein DL96DRAFT_1724506 [Flagelloscypha sp. PMI_526]
MKSPIYSDVKSAYFDSILKWFARWPEGSLPILSIVQDSLNPQFVPSHFAQPMVFSQLEPFSSLIPSDAPANITAFRLRILSRQVVWSLVSGSVTSFGSPTPPAYSSLTYLDLSSCSVLESDVESLLTSFFHALSSKESTEKESGRRWGRTDKPTRPATQVDKVQQTRRQRRGRKGVATAAIALKQPSDNDGPSSAALGFIPQNISVGAIHELPIFLLWKVPKEIVLFIGRILGDAEKMGRFLRFIFWTTPKFILWDIPKTFPDITKWFWEVLTVHLPPFLYRSAIGFWSLLMMAGVTIGHAIVGLVSTVHTAIMAVITLLYSASLQDIWNGFVTVLHALFVSLPVLVWDGLKAAVRGIDSFMCNIFGIIWLLDRR